MYPRDTIAAIATPLAKGAIGIIRVSGPESLSMLSSIFRSKSFNSRTVISHHLYYGTIIDISDQCPVDSVLAVFMRSPNSYTGEDIVEINCHSGLIVLDKILSLLVDRGARLAEPGEFTKRAFLNGRIDLTQAESIIDMIDSRSEAALKLAAKHNQGLLYEKLLHIKKGLIEIKSAVEVSIDFPEDENEIISEAELLLKSEAITRSLKRLLSTYNEGALYREGIKAVIIGKPNVGKSSLLNVILQDNRAIVTALPGTTRDIIKESIHINGVPVDFIDTAGLGTTDDHVEKIGIRKTMSTIDTADILLFVIDGSNELNDQDRKILKQIPVSKTIAVINKTDLPQKIGPDNLAPDRKFCRIISISALYNRGIDELKNIIYKQFFNEDPDISNDVIISNLRHKTLLAETEKSLLNVVETVKNSRLPELIAVDIQAALNAIGELTGETTSEDILNNIFSRFCIGK